VPDVFTDEICIDLGEGPVDVITKLGVYLRADVAGG
jgi:hypothetical protein